MTASGNFFAVDWRCVQAAGKYGNGPNTAAAYLALARFSGGSNSTTRAAVTALHSYLGMSRGRAAQALMDLENSGLVSIPTRGTTRKLSRWCDAEQNVGELTQRQREVFERVRSNNNPILSSSDADYQVAYALLNKGTLIRKSSKRNGSLFALPEPDLVYLPNSIVDGFDSGDPPLSRLRHLRDSRAFSILLDVYRLANIAEDGGLSPEVIRVEYNKVAAGTWGLYTVFAFNKKGYDAGWDPLITPFRTDKRDAQGRDPGVDEFWSLWFALHKAGLIETVEYLFNDTKGGEPLHPMSIYSGTPEERGVALAANSAGIRMLSDAQISRAIGELDDLGDGYGERPFLCPVPSHILRAQVIGVSRPVHRANTSRTRAWAANFLHRCEAHRANFSRLATSDAKSVA